MNVVFVDTSAILALLNPHDAEHGRARQGFTALERDESILIATSYVLVETYALLGRRLGSAAVRGFRDAFAPLIEVLWVGPALHERGLDLLLDRQTRDLSLVDAVSFVSMRERQTERAFAFDRHFANEGFSLVV